MKDIQKISLGISDFKQLREEKKLFVDKSLFIKDIINEIFLKTAFPSRKYSKFFGLKGK